MKRMMIAASVAAAALAGAAQADTNEGLLAATSADASVFAIRDGATLAVSAGDQLVAGDRLMTSGEGTATITFAGCSIDVPANSTLVLNDSFCDDQQLSGEGRLALGGSPLNVQGGSGVPVLVLGGLGVLGVILAVTTQEDDDLDDNQPTSP